MIVMMAIATKTHRVNLFPVLIAHLKLISWPTFWEVKAVWIKRPQQHAPYTKETIVLLCFCKNNNRMFIYPHKEGN